MSFSLPTTFISQWRRDHLFVLLIMLGRSHLQLTEIVCVWFQVIVLIKLGSHKGHTFSKHLFCTWSTLESTLVSSELCSEIHHDVDPIIWRYIWRYRYVTEPDIATTKSGLNCMWTTLILCWEFVLYTSLSMRICSELTHERPLRNSDIVITMIIHYY